MDKESVERLRYDRRLQRRTGWVEESAMESHLDELPDVSDKMTTGAALEDAEEESAGEAAPAPELGGLAQSESVPSPVGGGFGGDSGSGAL